eukprot:s2293_g10.t1
MTGWEEAVGLSGEVYAAGARPTLISFSSLMKSFQRGGQWELAICASHAFLQHSNWGKVDPIFCSIMSDSCGIAGRWAKALEVVSQQQCHAVEVDALSWGVAMSSCKRRGQWQEVLAFILAMSLLGVRRTTLVANAAIGTSHWEETMMFLEDLMFCLVPLDSVTLNSGLGVCDKAAQWRQILQLLTISEPFLCDDYSYNSAISALQRVSSWQLCLEVLLRLPQIRLKLDAFSLTGALQAAAVAVQWQRCLGLLWLQRGVVAQSPAMAACQRGQKWQLVLLLMRDLGSMGNLPDVLSYNAAMSSCQSPAWQHTLTLLKELQAQQLQVDPTLYSNAMTARVNGLWSDCLAFLSSFAARIDGVAMVSDASATNAVILSCVQVNGWDAAIHWFQQLRHDVLSSVVILDACARSDQPHWALQTSAILTKQLEASLLQIWKSNEKHQLLKAPQKVETLPKWDGFGAAVSHEALGVGLTNSALTYGKTSHDRVGHAIAATALGDLRPGWSDLGSF